MSSSFSCPWPNAQAFHCHGFPQATAVPPLTPRRLCDTTPFTHPLIGLGGLQMTRLSLLNILFRTVSLLTVSSLLHACGCGPEPTPEPNPPVVADMPDAGQPPVLVDGGYIPMLAPPLPPHDGVDFEDQVSWIYDGPRAVLIGADKSVFEAERLAVVRGRVLSVDERPLGNVKVTIVGHPEYGYTLTRADGWYDLVVNGGDVVVVQAQKDGLFPAQRTVPTKWNRFFVALDIVLVPPDGLATPVTFGAAALQVASGSKQSDGDGNRTTRVFFPPGTVAKMVLPNGSEMALTQGTFRATEYTVGANGPARMPGQLPPMSGYTYAAELSFDEALAAGALQVKFEKPVFLYVENFLKLKLGSHIPAASYDMRAGRWTPSNDGRILKLVNVNAGVAALDVDGDGAADADAALEQMGITLEERRQLAATYALGAEVWRTPVQHFSPWDCNFPYGPSPGDVPPDLPGPRVSDNTDNEDVSCGSVIGVQNRTLGESFGLTGTGASLTYASDRMPGGNGARSVRIPLSLGEIPDNVRAFTVDVFVAGRRERFTRAPLPNQTFLYTWDGKDAYGRTLDGRQKVTIRVGYEYQAVYFASSAALQSSWGTAARGVGAVGIISDRTNRLISLAQVWEVELGEGGIDAQQFGGLTLSMHHVYSPAGGRVRLGSGGETLGSAGALAIRTAVGNGTNQYIGDNGPPALANVIQPWSLAVRPDGTVFIAERFGRPIRKVSAAGNLTTEVGPVNRVDDLAGQPSVVAEISPTGIAFSPQGQLYFSDENSTVNRVSANGTIEVVAGTRSAGFSGDGGPATQAKLANPNGLAFASDGTLYIADSGNNRIRRITPDGVISTAAGNGTQDYADNVSALTTGLARPQNVLVLPSGELLIADTEHSRIRRLGLDGVISSFAGNGQSVFRIQDGPAMTTAIGVPAGLFRDKEGVVYFSTVANAMVASVDLAGNVKLVAGSGSSGNAADGTAALEANLGQIAAVAVLSGKGLLIADAPNNRVRLIDSAGILRPFAGAGEYYASGNGGPALNASIDQLTTMLPLPDGSVVVAQGCLMRKVDKAGTIRALAGEATCGFEGDNGPAAAARFSDIQGLAKGADGSILVADSLNNRIRKIAPDGIVTTIAGIGAAGFSGDFGPADRAKLNRPSGLAVDFAGVIYIADTENHRIRRVGLDGVISTIAGNGSTGSASGTNDSLGDNGGAQLAKLYRPLSVAVDIDGSLLIVDSGHERIRRVKTAGVIATVAGGGNQPPEDEGDALEARLPNLNGGLVPISGGLAFVSRDIIFLVGSDQRLNRLAGNLRQGYDGGNGFAREARFQFSTSTHEVLAGGPNGALFIADSNNRRVRVIEPQFGTRNLSEISVASPQGDVVWVFTKNGRHLRTIDALLGTVLLTFDYDPVGLLISVTDVDGKKLTIQRETNGNIKSITGPYGHVTAFELDRNGYVSKLTNPAGESVALTMSKSGLLTAMKDARGFGHTYEYDATGRLVKDSSPDDGFKALAKSEMSVDSLKVTLATAEGRVTSYVQRYQGVAENQEVTYPDETKSFRSFSNAGSSRTTSPVGTIVELTEGGDARFGVQAPFAKSVSVTLPSGLKRISERAQSVEYVDGAKANGIAQWQASWALNGKKYVARFTQADKRWQTETPEGRASQFEVDAKGQVIRSSMPNVLPVQYSYNAQGQLTQVTQGDRKVEYAYNAQGLVDSAKDTLGRQSKFAYDAALRPVAVTLPGGRSVSLTTDAHGNGTSLTPPGQGSHDVSYTPVDLLQSYSPPASSAGAARNTTSFAYNKDRELTSSTLPNQEVVQVAHDGPKGRPVAVRLPQRTVEFGYNATGQVDRLTTSVGAGLQFGYDGELLKQVKWSGAQVGTVSYVYDTDFRGASLSVNNTPVSYTYDKDSLLVSAGALTLSRRPDNGFLVGTSLGTLSSTVTHTPYGEMDTMEYKLSGAALFRESRSYDVLGRTVTKTEVIQGSTATFAYGYDTAGRLSTVSKDGVQVASYSYDGNGNRVSQTENGVTTAATFDGEDRIQTLGTVSYTFSSLGQLATKTEGTQTTRYQFDAAGTLTQVTLPGNKTVDYELDASGRRVGRKVDGVKRQGWLYDGLLRVVAETDAAGTVTSRFVYASQGHSPDFMVAGGKTFRLVKDVLGSVRVVVDVATGEVKQRIDYDAWGKVVGNSAPGFQPFGFAGGLLDSDTALTRFGAREYEATSGRWVTKDPIRFAGGDGNLFAYVGNRPVDFVDSSGLERDLRTGWGNDSVYGAQPQRPVDWSLLAPELVAGGVVAILATSGSVLLAEEALLGYLTGSLTAGEAAGAAGAAGAVGRQCLSASETARNQLANDLNFTTTTAERMSRYERFVPRATLAEAIQSGTRMADPQGAPGAVKIVQELSVNGKGRTLDIVYREADNTILHFLYK